MKKIELNTMYDIVGGECISHEGGITLAIMSLCGIGGGWMMAHYASIGCPSFSSIF